MSNNKPWYGKVSDPYIGYWSESDGISGDLSDIDDDFTCYPCVIMSQHHFKEICGDNMPSLRDNKSMWEFFPGLPRKKDGFLIGKGSDLWSTCMGCNNGNDIYFVTDDFESVYIFHVAIQTTYHLGRLFKCEFADYVLRKLKKV